MLNILPRYSDINIDNFNKKRYQNSGCDSSSKAETFDFLKIWFESVISFESLQL